MSSTDQSRVEFLTLDMERLTNDQADELPNEYEEAQDALSGNMVDIIVSQRDLSKNASSKQVDGASDQIRNAARSVAKN